MDNKLISDYKNRENEVVAQLIANKWHISFAESCTGGLAAATLVNVPDASKVLDQSFITYADSAKIRLLGVTENTIKLNGVVSEAVAAEMAEGVAKNSSSEVGVGISGIAGPTGGTAEKPVGTVCFGFSVCGTVTTYTKHFGNLGRNKVREMSVEFVYRTLCKLIP